MKEIFARLWFNRSVHLRSLAVASTLLVLLTLHVAAQDLEFQHFSTRHGLSQTNVWDIVQDQRGFIWVGTEDGLNVYDGYTFTIYRNNPLDSSSLSNSNIHCIKEDSSGKIWVATRYGLNLFDPKTLRFERFLHDINDRNSLSNNDVTSLEFDADNNLWAGTANGVNVFNPKNKTFKRYYHIDENPNSLPHNRITKIYKDKRNTIWIGTVRGLSKFENGVFENYKYVADDPSTIGSNRITSIIEGRDGELWVGSFDRGLNKFDRNSKTFKRYDLGDGPVNAGNYIYNLAEDEKGNIWIAADGSLSKFAVATETLTRYAQDQRKENSLSSNIVTEVFFDWNGRMWVGTRFGGLNVHDPGKYPFHHFKYNSFDVNSLSHNTVTCFEEDDNGNFWVGTDGGGLNYFDRKTRNFSHLKDRFTNNKILAVEKDKHGGLWIGMWSGGLNYYDPRTGKITSFKHDPDDSTSLSDNNVFYILIDRKENVWIGTWGNGLNRYNPQTNSFTRYIHDPKKANSIANFGIDCLLEDSHGKLWIASEIDGLDHFDPETGVFTHYKAGKKQGSISSNGVLSLFQDSKKRIWVGTTAGLNLFDSATQSFKVFRQKDGLPNDGIMGILEGSGGDLWLSTNKGLSRFNPEQESFKNFLETDGLQSDQFNRWASSRLSTGELLFGGTNGFNIFHPDSIRTNMFKPPVYITGFRLFNKPVVNGQSDILKQSILHTTEIRLTHVENIISFDFTALNYSQPEKNQYRYKMEGFQKDWVDAGSERKASYTNLSPGDYTFRVIASNNDGVWNEVGASMKIVITPPYWQTWWFKLAIIAIGLTGIYGLVIFRVNAVKKQQAFLEKQVHEKTAELLLQKEAVEAQAENMQALHEQQQAQTEYLQTLNAELQRQKEEIIAKREEAEKARREAEQANKAKSIFLATMSHEIRTPMNGVLGMAALLADTQQTPEQQEYTDTIRGSGEALLTVINDILDFSKIESGNMELEYHSFDLRQCIEDVMDVFAPKASQKELDLIYQIDYQIPAQIIGDSHRLRQVLLNLISNAMKFTHQGEIFVSVELMKMDSDSLELVFHVKDTGIGIPEDKLSRLFKAFSQVDSSTTRKYGGTGLGLVISERLVNLMAGSISVESQSGIGTTFTFSIKAAVSQAPIRQYVHFSTAGNEGKRVLVIDDNATNLRILESQLQQWLLIPVLADSGSKALEILQQSKPFDLIITDMQMPDMDGLQLSQQIKSKYAIPIVLLSSIGDESRRKHPELFAAVLNKPVKQQQFLKVVQSALRPHASVGNLPEETKAKQLLTPDFAKQYPLKILLAEDNVVNQKLALRVLSKLGYTDVVVAQTGLEAIEKFNDEFYEVILMDVQMPEMDGLEATRLIRMKQYHQPVIISMTANAMQDDREKCFQAGMDGYISKPINISELITALINAFDSYKPKENEVE